MKSILKLISFYFILGGSCLYSWEVNTHQALTRCAITNECKNDGSYRAENLQRFVNEDALLSKKDYSLQKYDEFPNYTYLNYAKVGEEPFFAKWYINFTHKGSYVDMIEAGSILEDAVYPNKYFSGDGRFNNHFYDPQQGGKKLSWGYESLVDIGLPDYVDAVTWAITGADLEDNRENDYAYTNALDYYKNSFVARDKIDREKNQAKMFVSLGHLLHLLQDMHVPAHVRDDSHSEYDLFEYWARDKGGFRLNRGKFQNVNVAVLNAVKEYNTLNSIKINRASDADNRHPISSSFYILEATYTSNNFLSSGRDKIIKDIGTIFDNDHIHPSKDSDVEKETVYENKRLGYIISAKYYYNSLGNTVNSLIPGNINPPKLAIETIKKWLDKEILLKTDDDDSVIIDNALNLIPRAVGASEAFINYFFRGRIEARIEDGKLVVKNISDPSLAQSPSNVVFKKGGHFIVKYDAKDGSRKDIVSDKKLDKDLNVNDIFVLDKNFIQTIDNIVDMGDEENIIVLYDGFIGQERGLAVTYASKKLTNIDLLLSFDKSGSMSSSIEDAKNSAIDVLNENFNDNNSSFVEIEAFNHDVTILLSYDNNISKAKSSIKTLYSGGGTALYDAIKKAGERAKQHKIDTNASKSIIILYTDGRENGDSSASKQEAINAISKANAPEIDEVFLIQVGSDSVGQQDLEDIAYNAGNRKFLNVNNASELKDAIDTILKGQ